MTECFFTHTSGWAWVHWLPTPRHHVVLYQQEVTRLEPSPIYPRRSGCYAGNSSLALLLPLQTLPPQKDCLNSSSSPEAQDLTYRGVKTWSWDLHCDFSSAHFPDNHWDCFAQIKPGLLTWLDLPYCVVGETYQGPKLPVTSLLSVFPFFFLPFLFFETRSRVAKVNLNFVSSWLLCLLPQPPGLQVHTTACIQLHLCSFLNILCKCLFGDFCFACFALNWPEVVAHTLNTSSREAEAGRPLWIPGHTDLHSEFQVIQSYTVRSCLKFFFIIFLFIYLLVCVLWHSVEVKEQFHVPYGSQRSVPVVVIV